ncbi:hypothetical protein DFP73DRAFT_387236 [Morchella snyderi]|nr:hypothetical protein DFP73DRAFT_387236 [Morchella snyderi]
MFTFHVFFFPFYHLIMQVLQGLGGTCTSVLAFQQLRDRRSVGRGGKTSMQRADRGTRYSYETSLHVCAYSSQQLYSGRT